ncbi:hypothetical protein BpHYR1_018313 [Brachionus plicatilis]|uniref:Uncharacterized protein n=1 Tax=Brachionus plicatilis TaxID=10195 RepID=A0A3M7RDT6_BRAPC|nr:hypothetical protein BpHYR1_018313 [Brachionus plicatilis]
MTLNRMQNEKTNDLNRIYHSVKISLRPRNWFVNIDNDDTLFDIAYKATFQFVRLAPDKKQFSICLKPSFGKRLFN